MTCPHCHQPVKETGANFCIHCGKTLNVTSPVVVNQSVAPASQVNVPLENTKKSIARRPLPMEIREGKDLKYFIRYWKQRNDDGYLGQCVNRHKVRIPNAAVHKEALATSFIKHLERRQIPETSFGESNLVIEKLSRRYYFVRKDFDDSAAAIVALGIEPYGTELIIEWRDYVLPPLNGLVNKVGMVIMAWATISLFLGWALGYWVMDNLDTMFKETLPIYQGWGTGGPPDRFAIFAGWVVGLIIPLIVAALIALPLSYRSGRLHEFQSKAVSDFQIVARDALTDAMKEIGLGTALEGQLF